MHQKNVTLKLPFLLSYYSSVSTLIRFRDEIKLLSESDSLKDKPAPDEVAGQLAPSLTIVAGVTIEAGLTLDEEVVLSPASVSKTRRG